MRERDLREAKRLIIEGRRDNTTDTPLPWVVLEGLKGLVPCDMVAVNLLDSRNEQATEHQDLPEDSAESDPAALAVATATFFKHYWDSEPCSYPDRTGDIDSVIRGSDFYTLRELRRTGMWSEFLQPTGLARELIACFGGVPGRTLRIVFWRGPGRDFTERDRALVWMLRPHLNHLYRSRRESRSVRAELTPRQWELLHFVAVGDTNRQIARRLGVTEATVRKHLEHAFHRLQVTNRTAAVARAFPDGVPETGESASDRLVSQRTGE